MKISLAIALALVCASLGLAEGTLVYFGAYTGKGAGQSKGIYFSHFDAAKGDAPDPELAVETESPSYLALHPNRRFVYATNESGPTGSVSAFVIDPATSKLTLLNKVDSGGRGPCYLAVDKSGKYLMVANFTAGNASVLRIKDDGSLGEQTALIQHTGKSINPAWQEGPRAHWVGFSPDNRFAFIVNLGNDQVFVYKFDTGKGSLTPNPAATIKMKAGYGPRNLTFHPNGKFAYLINQLSGAIFVFAWDAEHGILRQVQETTALPVGFIEEFNSAKVLVEPNGKFLYTSTRGSDTMAVFSIDPGKGTLTLIQQESSHGMSPRDFSLDPTGSNILVANQYSDYVNVLGVNRETGKLKRMRRVLKINSVSAVLFVPSN